MSDIAIRVEGLGKQYRIGKRERYRALRDTITDAMYAPFRRMRSVFRPSGVETSEPSETIWALKDVSFEIPRGEVVGVIGRNGAGKSTLLKVLSRITEPTEGRVEIHGRVGSLLEVGTGFHPELTGRENIYLNGAILGMRRAEIARKFDEIVAFAEVQKFIDTPVKHYSSGMYLRLAFAVAAHLEPEILIVDEVLAVGDSTFQKKCLGKIGEVAQDGRTVLFVSHNMTAIESLCGKCLLLQSGLLKQYSSSEAVIARYLTEGLKPHEASVSLKDHASRTPTSMPVMEHLRLISPDCDLPGVVRMGDRFVIEVSFDSQGTRFQPVLGIVVKSSIGAPLFTTNNRFIPTKTEEPLARGVVRIKYESLPLMPGTYLLDLYFGDTVADFDVIMDAALLEVIPGDVYGSGKLPSAWCGPFYCPASFDVESASDNPVHSRSALVVTPLVQT
jgi:lipopolysaccharide transport system ATP-binding protein